MRAGEGFELTPAPPPLRSLVRQLWASRDLIQLLARKDFFVRYKRASLGMIWAVGLPLVQAAVLAVVFSRIVRIETGGNYGVFVFAGLLPWSFFSGALNAGATAIVDSSNLASKIYFPRAVLPLVNIGAGLYGFFFGLLVLLVAGATIGPGLDLAVLLLVPAVALMVLLGAAFALVLSALHVYFRDVRFVLQAALLAWFYATPILYPLDLAPPLLTKVIRANPATGMVELYRAAVFTADPGWGVSVLITVAWTIALLALAAVLHQRYDRVFVDLL